MGEYDCKSEYQGAWGGLPWTFFGASEMNQTASRFFATMRAASIGFRVLLLLDGFIFYIFLVDSWTMAKGESERAF